MVTDVVIPEMKSPELAKRLSSLYPEMNVLYMSGQSQSKFLLLHSRSTGQGCGSMDNIESGQLSRTKS
jgi:FixJ family two-component response regulator